MNKKITFKRVLALGLAGLVSFGATSCGKTDDPTSTPAISGTEITPSTSFSTNENNEKRAFVMASQEVDQVFSPFYSSSTADASVVGMTQMGMLANDKDGNPQTHKQGASVVVEDYQIVKNTANNTSTYYFVLRNDVKFSNGSQLTIKDVLFNLYVYLDPTYNGSATLYSTDIVGLKQYRTQSSNENEQDSFMERFNTEAAQRIENLYDAYNYIVEKNPTLELTEENFKEKLQEYIDENGSDTYGSLIEDFEKTCELFREETTNDYNTANSTSLEDISFVDKDNKEYKNLFQSKQEIFFYNAGKIKWNRKEGKLENNTGLSYEKIRTMTEQECINYIYNDMIPNGLDQVITIYQTASELQTYLANKLSKEYLDQGHKMYDNISGITYANKDNEVTVNGTRYGKPTLDSDGNVLDGNQVLSITINGEDPKAIWNFAFAVAPMYYYSNEEQISKFDYESNFGVAYRDQDFRDKVLKDATKLKVPMGAGAYQAASSKGGAVEPGTFFDGTTIYFTRNDYFKDGETGRAAIIKNVYFRVVPTENILSSLYSNSVDYCEPSAKPETVTELAGKKSLGYETVSVKTQGYGYIGINASKVQNLYVRQAIMHSIKVDDIVSYYGSTATKINRSMSSESWAYPTGCTPYYPYIGDPIPSDLTVVNPYYREFVTKKGKSTGDTLTLAEQKEFIDYLIGTLGKVKKDANGQYSGLEYTFTIAGASDDHPAYNAFNTAKNFLNSCGLQIVVSKDSLALRKLTSGDLEVWAAAWSSTLDPDMYQVYHKDSSATAILNWGYPSILNNSSKYPTEYKLINELSTIIMQARKTTNQSERKNLYSEALDIVMQLAIELPTYQREDLSAFNGKVVERNSLNVGDELTSVKGVTTAIWRASLVA